MIPDHPSPGTQSRAELRVFDYLRDETGSQFTAFHHVAWLVPDARGAPRHGEADFVLAHPEFGALVLEVKGGGISYDADTGTWTSHGSDGPHRIKDPVEQARGSAFVLAEAVRRASGQAPAAKARVGYGIGLPDTHVATAQLRLDAPRDIVIDANDMMRLTPALDKLFAYWNRTATGAAPSISILRQVLANSFDLRAPLAAELAEQDRALLRLTEQQYQVLDMVARQTRVAIAGCAGSGKTFLAAEKARRLAAQGFRVLVVCFNLLLAEHLRRGLSDVAAVDVFAYYELCEAVVAEVSGRQPSQGAEEPQKLYYPRLHAEFENSVASVAGRYGALIVDEAQDFDAEWWLPLQLLLVDPDKSPIYAFFDDNQNIFHAPRGMPIESEPIQLTVNCRNTQRIHRVVGKYYHGTPIAARGPEGIPVDVHAYATRKEMLTLLDKTVRSWVTEAGVAPGDIALLTPGRQSDSALWWRDEIGGFDLTDDPWDRTKILRCSIFRFKGLERLVVGVVELDGASSPMLYTAFSRASVFLSVFCPRASRNLLPRELAKQLESVPGN